MCNEAFRRTEIDKLRKDLERVGIAITFPEGIPNAGPHDSIRITDRVEVVLPATGGGALVTRRWSWPAPNGKPVFNFRSEGRQLANGARSGRCIVPLDGFFEFGMPPVNTDLFGDAAPARPGAKAKWQFAASAGAWIAIAGWWRRQDDGTDAFAMLTCEPGPDVAPYHARQVVVVAPDAQAAWLDGSADEREICRPSPAGTLIATRVR